MVLGTVTLGTPGDEIQFSGGGYAAYLNPTTLSFTGQGYVATLSATVDVNYGITFTGQGYAVVPSMFGGFILDGSGYNVTLSATLLPDYNTVFNGRGYQASLVASVPWVVPATLTGRGYVASLVSYGGFRFTGHGYSVSLSATSTSSERITFTGEGYAAGLQATVLTSTAITFTGTGYRAELSRQSFTGRGYAVNAQMSVAIDTAYAEAFVMNIMSNEVSRYTEYPFMHIARVGSVYYGVKSDGLYALTGNNDDGATIASSITTKDTDFGVFQSKNVPYIYVDTDAELDVTPIVDEVETNTYTATFGGRKVKLGRGNKGRYWAFKLDNITTLQGLEYLPDQLQRRVK